MISPEPLRRRWDVTEAEAQRLDFPALRALLNLRRLELACLAALVDLAAELLLGFRDAATIAAVPLTLAFLAATHLGLRRKRATRLRSLPILFFAAALLNTQWAIAELASHGRLSNGYPLTLLGLALLFVLPPRTLLMVAGAAFVGYCLVVVRLPVLPNERWTAIGNAALATGVSIVAGWLIHTARRTDHEQKRQVRVRNEALRRRDAELEQVMAVTAHDLRSPLHGLRNLFDLTLRRMAERPDLPQVALTEGIASIDAMIQLVTRLLDAHAAEHAPLARLRCEDLRDHVAAAARRIGPRAVAAEVSVGVQVADARVDAVLEPGALAQILDNLLANAVRHAPPGSTIRIACVEGDEPSILVEDEGPGVPADLVDALFAKFVHRHDPHHAGPRGKGMGLFIAATLAARIGATLHFRGGAVFEVRFAKRASDLPD